MSKVIMDTQFHATYNDSLSKLDIEHALSLRGLYKHDNLSQSL